MSGYFVLSVDIEDVIDLRPAFDGGNAPQRRPHAASEAMRRLVRLLEGHAVPATWVVRDTAWRDDATCSKSEVWSDRMDPLLDAIAGLTTQQEIALSSDGADGPGFHRLAQLAARSGSPLPSWALRSGAPLDPNRHPAFGALSCRPTPPSRSVELIDDLFQRPIPMWRPSDLECAGRISNVPISMALTCPDGERRLVPAAARLRRIRTGLARAADRGAIVHLALRLADLQRSGTLFRAIEDILFHVAEMRVRRGLEVATIDALRRARDVVTRPIVPGRAA